MAGFLQKVTYQLFAVRRAAVQQSIKCQLRMPTVLQIRMISYSDSLYGDDESHEAEDLFDDKYIGKIGDSFADVEKLPRRRKKKEKRQRKQMSYDEDSVEYYDDYYTGNEGSKKHKSHSVSIYTMENLETHHENSQAKRYQKIQSINQKNPATIRKHNWLSENSKERNEGFYSMNKADLDFPRVKRTENDSDRTVDHGVELGHSVIENQAAKNYRSPKQIGDNHWNRFQFSGPVALDTTASQRRSRQLELRREEDYDIDDVGRIVKKKPVASNLTLNFKMDPIKKSRNMRVKQNDADSFGTLNNSTDVQPHIDDDKVFDDDPDEDGTLHLRLSTRNRKHPPNWYENKIKALGKEGKVRECIEVFEVWMLKNDRVLPTCSVVSTYLGVLGRAGYTKKAFKVYNQMKKMKGVTLHEPTYTALFNACANSPWKEDGLKRAVDLRNLMLKKDIQPDSIVYKAMIKAFGCLGDFPTAFLLADEAASNKISIDVEYFSFLVMAAISDKNAGFRYGVEIWRKMLQWHIKPDIYLYNLLLKLTHECGIGNKEDFHLMFAPTSNPRKKLSLPAERTMRLEEGSSNHQEVPAMNTLPNSAEGNLLEEPAVNTLQNIAVVTTDMEHEQLPDILNPKETYSDVVAMTDIETAQDRLGLLGGLEGFLKRMKTDNVVPNILTFTQLLNVVDTDKQVHILRLMEEYKVEPDVVFFNAMIHQRCMRHDMEAAKAVVPLMTKHLVTPDMRTYSGLALTCKDREDGLKLIDEIQDFGMMPNSVVFGSLIYASAMNFIYKMDILKKMESLGVSPSERLLKRIETQMTSARRSIPHKNKWFEDSFESFRKFYEEWLQRVNVEPTDHPWKSFSIRHGNQKQDPDRFKTKLEAEQRVSKRRPIEAVPKKKKKHTIRVDN